MQKCMSWDLHADRGAEGRPWGDHEQTCQEGHFRVWWARPHGGEDTGQNNEPRYDFTWERVIPDSWAFLLWASLPGKMGLETSILSVKCMLLRTRSTYTFLCHNHTHRKIPPRGRQPSAAHCPRRDSGTVNCYMETSKWVFRPLPAELAPSWWSTHMSCSSGELGCTNAPFKVTDTPW